MANNMLLDDTRALRREQREARIARKHERRQARQLKRQHTTTPLAATPLPASTRMTAGDEEVAVLGVPEPAIAAPAATADTIAAEPNPGPGPDEEKPPARAAARRPARSLRRERDVAEFLARRDQAVSLARTEAGERIERFGDEQAVRDALIALAHPQASRWRQHRERLSEAMSTGQIPTIGAAARRACRGAAGDAARTSRRAPDPQLALAVTVAYAVIARAPWAAVRTRRAERSAPTGRPLPRAFWR
jgi:hypothetical protein